MSATRSGRVGVGVTAAVMAASVSLAPVGAASADVMSGTATDVGSSATAATGTGRVTTAATRRYVINKYLGHWNACAPITWAFLKPASRVAKVMRKPLLNAFAQAHRIGGWSFRQVRNPKSAQMKVHTGSKRGYYVSATAGWSAKGIKESDLKPGPDAAHIKTPLITNADLYLWVAGQGFRKSKAKMRQQGALHALGRGLGLHSISGKRSKGQAMQRVFQGLTKFGSGDSAGLRLLGRPGQGCGRPVTAPTGVTAMSSWEKPETVIRWHPAPSPVEQVTVTGTDWEGVHRVLHPAGMTRTPVTATEIVTPFDFCGEKVTVSFWSRNDVKRTTVEVACED